MRVTIVSHTYVAAINHEKLEALAASGRVHLQVIVPRRWKEGQMGRVFACDPAQVTAYQTVVVKPTVQRGGTLYALPFSSLQRAIRTFDPDIIHVEEAPWALIAGELAVVAKTLAKPLLIFSWENQHRGYPYPLGSILKFVLRSTTSAIAGNAEAESVLRSNGFRGPVNVLPQLGVDPDRFSPGDGRPIRERLGLDGAFVIGFLGRLVPEKGVQVLLEAFARMPGDTARLLLVGAGPARGELKSQAVGLGVDNRIVWLPTIPHEEVVSYLRAMDILVLPSITTARWKEQFGHVLIEAMACGIPVVGSESGEIPNVIGDAGLTFGEGNAGELSLALARLQLDRALRGQLAEQGRSRVLDRYTHEAVANRTLDIYEEVVRTRLVMRRDGIAPATSSDEELKRFYASSDIYLKHLIAHDDPCYFQNYVRCIRDEIPPGSRILDVGCGTGFSSTLLGRARYQVVGMDVSPKFLAHRAQAGEGSEPGVPAMFMAGDAAHIPAADGSFDAVASFNTMEHLPDVAAALGEMERVLRPGGCVVVLGPNILSPYRPAMYLAHILRGQRGLPTFYETPSECLRAIVGNAAALPWKRARPRPPEFRYRVPVLDTWEWEDTDADCVYLANPVDLSRYFRARGWTLQRYQGEGQGALRTFLARLIPDFAGGIVLVARKPGHNPAQGQG